MMFTYCLSLFGEKLKVVLLVFLDVCTVHLHITNEAKNSIFNSFDSNRLNAAVNHGFVLHFGTHKLMRFLLNIKPKVNQFLKRREIC